MECLAPQHVSRRRAGRALRGVDGIAGPVFPLEATRLMCSAARPRDVRAFTHGKSFPWNPQTLFSW
jgi:hypothetical protein